MILFFFVFNHCGTRYTKKYWDVIFDQPTKVEPIKTPLTGGLLYKFTVHIPTEFQKWIFIYLNLKLISLKVDLESL